MAGRRWTAMLVALLFVATSCGKGDGDTIERGGDHLLVAPKELSEAGVGYLGTRLALVHGCVGLEFTDNRDRTAVVIWPHGTEWISTDPLAIKVPGVGRVELGDQLTGGGATYRGSHPLAGVDVPTSCQQAPLVSFTPDP